MTSSPDKKISVILSGARSAQSKDPDAVHITSFARCFLTTTLLCIAVLTLTLAALAARAELEPWLQSAVAGSAIEAALYRAMDLPGLRTLYPRPPAEARTQLDALVAAKPEAELFALRAHIDEQSLDFTAADHDWQAFVAHSQNKASANLELADFYHRRNLAPQEIAALEAAATPPSTPAETFLPADQQPAWLAFPRALAIAHDQALGDDATLAIYQSWLARYPAEPSVRANLIATLLQMRRFDDARRAIEAYKSAFPQDPVLPLKAAALLAFDQATPDATTRALTLFDQSWQPLWPSDLVATYFQLLSATHTQHAFLAATRVRLQQNPDDLIAATKLFACYQQLGRTDAALNSLTQYGASKDARHTTWSADELYTFATLLNRAGDYPAAARFYFALAATPGQLTAAAQSPSQTPEEAGLTGLIDLLLRAPDAPLALGAGNVGLYKDIATLDPGPGYLNGILSLWLNSQDPAAEFHAEELKATPYFHRAKAAELLTVLDQRFPTSAARPALHAALLRAYLNYGQDAAVRDAGTHFLADFPHAPQRLEIALDLADADARANDSHAEFALYDNLLTELATDLHGLPLTAAASPTTDTTTDTNKDNPTDVSSRPEAQSAEAERPAVDTATASPATLLQQSLTLPITPPATTTAAAAYMQVLNRYLSRLTTTGQLPAALAVLRRELDRNPNDPLLYERVAAFLQQNNLDAQEEEVYQRAIARFNTTSFYDKLARFYLRRQRREAFTLLARQVVDIFHGTELEQYFGNVHANWPQEYLQLNLYAHRRFPHDLAFTRNLLSAYGAKPTADPAARSHLLREHWQESSDLQTEFFDSLSRSGQLTTELAALQALVPNATQQQQNPAATRELAELDLWQSHFEQGAPLLGQLADAYPADPTLGDQAASVFRSLAYFTPANATRAATIAQHLSAADPTSLDRLAAIGDTLADSTSTSLNLDSSAQLAQAAPFWQRMAAVHPGTPDGYLQSATVFWDYFQFAAALAQINAARARFHNPALFAYQAGAIDEAKRDDSRAVAEYTAAAIAANDEDTDGADARTRLLTLATRPSFATLVDQATASAVTVEPSITAQPSVAALTLRADVLTALHRPNDLAPLLQSAIAHATTVDALAALADFAQQHHLPLAAQSALQRQIALSGDPVQQMQLQLQLAHSYVDAKDLPAAQRIIESLYTANPRIVGVVRATVDFYWDHAQPRRAVATLTAAAHQANPSLARDYTLEAVDKSNRSGDFTGARSLLQPLLAADPFTPQLLNLQAQSFSLAHDPAGLRGLYTSTLTALQAAPLSATDRRDKIALARQGLIPALSTFKDYEGAMAQHIALIAAFPEDDGILQAAIAYARLHQREPQLVAFLTQTVAASPRDSRFAIDLARVDVQLQDNAGALAAYSHAIAIRAARPDLFVARANLEEHAQAFDAACADYDRLYKLTYNDPRWMQKSALARARQGKPDLAVKALTAAWIDGRPPAAANQFKVAQQLEQWNLLPQAAPFVAQGIQLAGDDLLTNPDDSDGVLIVARLLARQRKAPEAIALLTRLLQAADASPSAPAVIVQQVEKQGIAAVTDSQWRAQFVAARRQRAQTTFRNALLQIATVAADFYTPEQKSAFATLLDQQHAAATPQQIADLWIPIAPLAALKDREAAWRRDLLLHGGPLAAAQLEPFDALEAARMDNTTRAETLDLYATQLQTKAPLRPKTQPNSQRNNQLHALTLAAAAWHDAGNTQRESLDLRQLVLVYRQQQQQQRLFEIYLHGDPAALLQLAAAPDPLGDAAANFLLANVTEDQASRMVAARTGAPPVWRSANTALLGLYFADFSAPIDTAFQSTLGDLTLATRLTTPPNPATQLIGDPWFPLASRYGLFLALAPTPAHDPEDFLPAPLELSASDPANYTALAQTYLDAHHLDAAIAEYGHVIELDPTNPSPDIAIAEALGSAGRRDPSIASFHTALTKLRAMVDLNAVPEEFWTAFAAIAADAHQDNLGPTLQPAMDAVLSAYLRKNGNYRAEELLHSAFTALTPSDVSSRPEARTGVPGGRSLPAGVESAAVERPVGPAAWTLSLIAQIPSADQLSALTELAAQTWFPAYQRDALYRRQIAVAQSQLPSATPDDDTLAQLTALQTAYLHWLLDHSRIVEAQTLFDSIPATQQNDELRTLAVLLAARQSRLPALLDSFIADPTTAPSLGTLSTTANTLRLNKDFANSRLLLEYVFTQKLQQQQLTPADYLALAQARIATADMPGALDLLRRLTLQGDLYENLDSAAALLERSGHPAEALPLLTELANGTPWIPANRLRLARAQLALHSPDAATSLTAVASNDSAAYSDRAAAAIALHGITTPAHFDSAELTLLATTIPTPAQATQPYFVYARYVAAIFSPLPQLISLVRAAIAIAPDDQLNRLRLQLFFAESIQSHYTQAAAAIAPLLAAHPDLRSPTIDASSPPESSLSPSTYVPSQPETFFSINTDVSSRPEHSAVERPAVSSSRLTFLLTLASVDEHLGNLALAADDLHGATTLTSDPAQISQLNLRIAALHSQLDLQQQNAARRPVIQSKSPTQTDIVRPRLTVAAAQEAP